MTNKEKFINLIKDVKSALPKCIICDEKEYFYTWKIIQHNDNTMLNIKYVSIYEEDGKTHSKILEELSIVSNIDEYKNVMKEIFIKHKIKSHFKIIDECSRIDTFIYFHIPLFAVHNEDEKGMYSCNVKYLYVSRKFEIIYFNISKEIETKIEIFLPMADITRENCLDVIKKTFVYDGYTFM